MRAPASTPARLEIVAYDWPEVTAGTDLAELVGQTVELMEGDIVVVTSKVVSKAEGLVARGRRAEVAAAESTRVVAHRGTTVICETRHGLVMAAAGVDASNVPAGFLVTLPADCDESARRLRSRLYDVTGRNVAVVVTDTAGRAWRNGQTDLAVGCAGLAPLVDLAGTRDSHGNLLSVTAPAVADELAAAADLVKGKATGRPLAVVRGQGDRVLAHGEPGPGAVILVRGPDDDLFGLGTREAVRAASIRRDASALAHFPRRVPADPEPFDGVRSGHRHVRVTCAGAEDRVGGDEDVGWLVQLDVHRDAGPEAWLEAGRLLEKVESLAAAQRLLRTAVPTPGSQVTDWQTVTRTHWSVA